MGTLSKKEVQNELWRRGILAWKLDANQKALYDLFYNSEHKIHSWLLARRSGKSWSLCIVALEQCIRVPNSIVKFVAPTKSQVTGYLRDLMNQILEDCPEDMKPEFRQRDYIYYFKNGSEIQLAGSDAGHAERLRGGSSHISIIDEAGDVKQLGYIMRSILLPTTLTTHGKIIIAGTPPKDGSDHDFVKLIETAEANGSLIRRTVYDNPRLTPEDVANTAALMGGIGSDEFRREFLCEIIKDGTTSVIPEFTAELEKEVVKEWPRPPFFDAYESMDLGFKDLTVILFGYYDFRAAKLIIEDEYVTSGVEMQLPKLIKDMREKERGLWFNVLTNELKKPYLRISDINYIVTTEISRASNNEINFIPAKKDDNDAAINNLRVMLASKKVVINPRCKTLIRHLRNVKWASQKNKTKFARSPDNGHYDAVDALKYMIRHVGYTKNPYPAHYDMNTKELYIHNPSKFGRSQPNLDIYRQIFNIKRKE